MNAFLDTPNQPPANPVLSGSIVGGQMQLAWAATSNCSAYMATNLGLANWQLLTNQPQTNNGRYFLNLPATNGVPQFFRLSQP